MSDSELYCPHGVHLLKWCAACSVPAPAPYTAPQDGRCLLWCGDKARCVRPRGHGGACDFAMGGGMRFAYADPPYLGCGARLYQRPEWDDIATHRSLIATLERDYPDGWAMSLSSTTLRDILPLCPADVRVGSWCKSFASFKPNVNPAYCWEPVIWRGGRTKRSRKDDTTRDYHVEPITLRRGIAGAKPPGFALWIVNLLGADVRQGDTITDLFHGSGAMLGVWRQAEREVAV